MMINRYDPKPEIESSKVSLDLCVNYLRAIVQTLRQPLLVLDSDLKVKIANKSFYKKFRVKRRGTENQLLSELGNGQWNIPKLLELLKTVLTKKAGFEDYEMEYSFPQIGTKIMLLDASQIYNGSEATQTILLSMADVTKQRKKEKKLKQLNTVLKMRGLELEQSHKEIKKKLKVKADFTARVSHELRTPLTAIKESVNIVYSGAAGAMEEQKLFLGMAKRNLERLGRLVDNVLDFSKLESGNKIFEMFKDSINDLILEAGSFYEPLAVQKKIRIRYDLQPDIPEIKFDYDSILQVFTNILSNTVKFTEQGEIVIHSKPVTGGVEISVQDTGMGIEKKDMKRLFRPFEQIEDGSGHKMEGTGLGLTISKQIVEQHHGKISIHSEIKKGTLVCIFMPLNPSEVIAHEVEACLTSS